MGIIRAAINAVTGGLADSWLEVIEPSPMGNNDVLVPGQPARRLTKRAEARTKRAAKTSFPTVLSFTYMTNSL